MVDAPLPSATFLTDPELSGLIVENAREYAILTLSEDGLITGWSNGAERIFGYRTQDILGRAAAQLFVSADVAAGADKEELDTARAMGRAEDSRWHLRKDGERFWGNGVAMWFETPLRRGFLKILRDETRSKLADEQRVLLLNELNHRIKNILAVAQSIAEQTLRSAKVEPSVRAGLSARLRAMAKAHDLLLNENWAEADLRTVLAQTLAPHGQGDPPAFRLDGPSVRLSPPQAVSLSMVLHELATNAVKYGALSAPPGRIDVSWNVAIDGEGGRHLSLLWQESGGPLVPAPTRTGFGTRLIERTFGLQSGATAKLDYRPEGVCCVLQWPLSQASELPILDPLVRDKPAVR